MTGRFHPTQRNGAPIADVDVLDAIAELSSADPAVPDPVSERELVQLRHRAFDLLDKQPGKASWPPAYADPVPESARITDEVPTIDGSDLTADVVGGALTRRGCLRVNQLVDATTVTNLREMIDTAFDDRERAHQNEDIDDTLSYAPFSGRRVDGAGFRDSVFVRVSDVPRSMRVLTDIFERSGLRSAVTSYFGERPAMIADKWVLRRSPTGGKAHDYHQDGAFLGDGIRTMNCWIALSDCGPGTGRPSMDFVPRRFPLLPSGENAIFNWSLNPDTVEQHLPDAPVVSPVFSAGDALIFDEVLPHRTGVGTDLGPRYAIESWFVAPSSYQSHHVPFVL